MPIKAQISFFRQLIPDNSVWNPDKVVFLLVNNVDVEKLSFFERTLFRAFHVLLRIGNINNPVNVWSVHPGSTDKHAGRVFQLIVQHAFDNVPDDFLVVLDVDFRLNVHQFLRAFVNRLFVHLIRQLSRLSSQFRRELKQANMVKPLLFEELNQTLMRRLRLAGEPGNKRRSQYKVVNFTAHFIQQSAGFVA